MFKTLNLNNVFVLVGIITLFFNLIRIIILIATDYPWKWELIPLHLCRFYIILISILLIIKKIHLIKYFAIPCIVGSLAAFLFANLGVVQSFIKDDIKYNSLIKGTVEYENAGTNLGVDNYFFWDYILTHSYVLIMPIFLTIVFNDKAKLKLKEFLLGNLYLFIFSIFIFFLNWICFAIGQKSNSPKIQVMLNSNWLYLGRDGVTSLGPLSKWPQSIIGLVTVIFIIDCIIYFVYTLFEAIKFDFKNKKINFIFNKNLYKIKQ
uniref:TMEM164 family acyltransferase n=1 Tax=Mesomycoplasma neurolyticum TaxID=2120 RepID=UPI00101DEDB9